MDAKEVELIGSHSEESLSNEYPNQLQQSNVQLQDAESDEDVMVSEPPAKVMRMKSRASVL